MATIEPRLIHLLNDAQSPDLPPAKRPPLVRFSTSTPGSSSTTLHPTANNTCNPSSLSVALPPIELDSTAQQRADKSTLTLPLLSKQIPSFHSIADEVAAPARQLATANATAASGWSELSFGKENIFAHSPVSCGTGGGRTSKSVHPLQLLQEEPEPSASSNSLRMILDDAPRDILPSSSSACDDLSTKKRQRTIATKDEQLQLPHPLKKQKSTQNVQQTMPPIINGLHEPPPDAAMFPPIACDDGTETSLTLSDGLKMQFGAGNLFVGGDGQGVAQLLTDAVEKQALAGVVNSTYKGKRRAKKPRRKWTEEETNHLLLGVNRHGVGKWTTILDDPDFTFNDRTAGDLKDRFRTCCPDELRRTTGVSGTGKGKNVQPINDTAIDASLSSPDTSVPKPQGSLQSAESTLVDPESPIDKDDENDKPTSPSLHQESDSAVAAKPKKNRTHRKKMEDLAELGIRAPFKKSHRRERRPFTEDDDKQILEGLEQYGPAWTKIQRDPKFNLSSRQPTDLRDRVRNKYPEVYARIEKGNFQIKDPMRASNNLLEPSVNTTMDNSLMTGPSGKVSGPLDPQPHLNRSSSKDDMLKWTLPSSVLDTSDSLLTGPLAADFPEPPVSSAPGNAGEMDISRLLLDDSQVAASNSSDHIRFGSSFDDHLPQVISSDQYPSHDRRAFG